MNPQQEPSGNPYDFIMDPNRPVAKKTLIGGGDNSFLRKLVFIIGGAAAVMIITAGALTLFGSSKANTGDLLSVVQTQTELIRVASFGTNGSSGLQSLKNYSMNTQLTLSSQKVQFVSLLSALGVKVTAKEVVLKKNPITDKQLAQAKQTDAFDSVFTQLMQTKLNTYAKTLSDLYANSANNTNKQLFKNDYNQVLLLIAQAPPSSDL